MVFWHIGLFRGVSLTLLSRSESLLDDGSFETYYYAPSHQHVDHTALSVVHNIIGQSSILVVGAPAKHHLLSLRNFIEALCSQLYHSRSSISGFNDTNVNNVNNATGLSLGDRPYPSSTRMDTNTFLTPHYQQITLQPFPNLPGNMLS